MNKKIDEKLNMVPMEEIRKNQIAKREDVVRSEDENSENDYKYARENFYTVIEAGTSALEDMIDVARQSQHPRAYEVLSTIMKTLVDANKELVDMSNKKKEEKQKAEKEDDAKTVNQSVHFHGTTEEMRKMLNKVKNNDDDNGE